MPGIQLIRCRPEGERKPELLLITATEFKWMLLIPIMGIDSGAWLVDFQTFLALFLLRVLKVEEEVEIRGLDDKSGSACRKACSPGTTTYWFLSGSLRIHESDGNCGLGIFEKLKIKLRPPVLVSSDGSRIITGPCAVLRELLMHFSQHGANETRKLATTLLGFRKACLSAPAQSSPWARFCELDAPEGVKQIAAIAIKKLNDEPVPVPVALARLEEHFKHPIRCHNVRRKKQDLARQKGLPIERNSCGDPKDWKVIEERYVEGIDLTLADIMLFLSVQLMFYQLNRSIAKKLLPKCNEWLKKVGADLRLAIAIPTINEACKDLPKLEVVSTNIPVVPKETLYKRDPERYDPKKRIFTRQEKLGSVLEKLREFEKVFPEALKRNELPWDEFPSGVNLVEEHLPSERLIRKRQQVENMIEGLRQVVKPGDRIVEFCCGGGHLGLVVACIFLDAHVVFLDSKQQSLDRAASRAEDAGLTNVSFCLANLEHFKAEFDVGIALHACGSATDMVIFKCLETSADFVVSPCCYGAVSFVEPSNAGDSFSFVYPQSKRLAETLTREDYMRIAHSADQTHVGGCKDDQGNDCMAWADSDRLWMMEEGGYRVKLWRMTPASASVKNHVLIAARRD